MNLERCIRIVRRKYLNVKYVYTKICQIIHKLVIYKCVEHVQNIIFCNIFLFSKQTFISVIILRFTDHLHALYYAWMSKMH